MFCQNCGEKLEPQAKFCPHCSCKVITPENVVAAKPPKSKAKFWLKSILLIAFAFGAFAVFIALETKDPVDTVEQQLEALRQDHITEAYYSYTSKSFQENTSLENFRQFVKHNPAFLKTKSIEIVGHHIEKTMGLLEARLSTLEGKEIEVQYQLIFEGDKWKILSIKPLSKSTENQTADNEKHTNDFEKLPTDQQKAQNEEPLPTDQKKIDASKTEKFDDHPFLMSFQGLLEQIKQKDYAKAYNDFTSQAFKKATTLEAFTEFAKNHPAFATNQSFEFREMEPIDSTTVAVKGMISSTTNKMYPIEFDLVSENGTWKILHIEVSAPIQAAEAEKKPVKTIEFSDFVLGTTVNGRGIVTNPSRLFTRDSGEIHLNLHIKEAVAGTQIEVAFEHKDSHSTAPPSSARIPTDGNLILSFAFTPPEKGWPNGDYHVEAKSSTGVNAFVEFAVE